MPTANERRGARVTLQLREPHNMTYELECRGARLILRVFRVGDSPTEWRIEARVSDAADAVVATATAASRPLALESVAQWWRENAAARALAAFDWNAIAQAMTAVRAI